MGKGKNKQNQQGSHVHSYEQQVVTDYGDTTNVENKNNPAGTILLGVYIHCEGCANEVTKCLRGFEGVEGVEIDAKNHKVIVTGRKADPVKVAERLRKKTGKNVELISPKPKKEEKKEEKKPQPIVLEVLLKMYIHCEGCAKDVKQCIHKMEGVQTVDPDMTKNQVIVKGTMDPKKLVEFINKRTGKNAEIFKQSNVKTNKSENQGSKNENVGHRYNYSDVELVYAPQLFSDENPNSCSIM